jgi:hypothetical protein
MTRGVLALVATTLAAQLRCGLRAVVPSRAATGTMAV